MAIATTAYINLELLLEEVVVLLEAGGLVACGFLFFDIESAYASKTPRGAPMLRTRRRMEHLWLLRKTVHHSVHYV